MTFQILTDGEHVARWAETFRTAPVAARLTGLDRTALEVFLACKAISRHCFILESLEDAEDSGRYTFIGYDPVMELTCKDGTLTIHSGADVEMEVDSPAPYITKVVADTLGPRVEGLPPFTGGLAGYISFDYLTYAEPSVRLDAEDEENFRDIDLMLFDKVIAFDNLTNEVFLIATIKLDLWQENYNRALRTLDDMASLVTDGALLTPQPLQVTGEFEALFDKDGFADVIARAKNHIYEGDIFQVVLSNRLRAPAVGNLFDTYTLLRQTNPSPYMFYFSSDDLEIAGASPETLVKLTGEDVVTFPLAGTRPRGKTEEEDSQAEADLLADEKELAEHNMLVDLGRNDVGKIAQIGTVEVRDYLSVLRFSHVMHIGSAVTGKVRPGVSAMDVVDAVLPAGTLSGAPKIRACEIINDLEGIKRGVYGGAIGYISSTGDLDTCIAIRLAY
ncbi:MAG: chorismate-binding protein, partial [Propionibacteriaceae bacterium]|nr:chorismate-binding protein [Propionibacteriaceae bacterium]